MIKTIFFDIDDTLYDHQHHISSGIAYLRKEYDFLRKYSQRELEALGQRILEEVHCELLSGSITLEESRLKRWQRFLSYCNDPEYVKRTPEVIKGYTRAYYEVERAIPGAAELLHELKTKFSIGVISN